MNRLHAVLYFTLLVLTPLVLTQAATASEPLRIYIDADFSNHHESSESIERGIKTALAGSNSLIQGRPVEVVRLDHRGNTVRSKRHIGRYLADDNALLMVAGIHSPPMLAHRDYINDKGVLFLVPWAAAGPITRAKGLQNWIFRLSIDDTKAGAFLSQYAVQEQGHKRPLLLLENTGWGKSNHRTMTRALAAQGIEADVAWFDWSIGDATAASIMGQAVERGNDVVLLVANALEGVVIARAASLHKLPIVSHWGITGGNFHEKIDHKQRQSIDLKVLQTRFSFLSDSLTEYQKSVYLSAQRLFPEIKKPGDIKAPTGFVHAHDLTKILITALETTPLSGDMRKDRKSVRDALENISDPIEGLIKVYSQPFARYTQITPDSHEALDIRDFSVAEFTEANDIRLLPWQFSPAE